MDIGFYLIHADHSEKSNAVISLIGDMINNNPYDNIILFNSQYNRIDSEPKKFPIIHLNQAKYFRGTLIIFDIKSAMITRSFPAPQKQFFYVDEASWSSDLTIPVMFWHSIYNNKDIRLIAKNKEIHDLIDICWSKPVAILETLNHEKLYDIIK